MGRLRVLFVDDDVSRFKRLRSIVADAGALAEIRWRSCARAVTDEDLAWAALVFLDHDMCEGGEYPNPCPRVPPGIQRAGACDCPTGRAVAERIAAMDRPPRVVIQSVNPVGAERMSAILQAEGRVAGVRFPVTHWHGRDAAAMWREMAGGLA